MARHGENIHKRKDGRFEARYIIKYENGKAVYKSVYAKSYKAVKEKRDLAMQLLKSNVHELPTKENSIQQKKEVSFEILSKNWLQEIRHTVKESTYCNYHDKVYNHIIPNLGGEEIHSLTKETFHNFTTFLLENGRKDKKGGLAPKTVNDIHNVLKQILLYAIQENWIKSDLQTFPNTKNTPTAIHILSTRNQKVLVEYMKNNSSPKNLGILISLFTGARIGEVCSLKYSDVNFETGYLSINKTLQRVKNLDKDSITKTKIIITSPKSETSKRILPLPLFLLQLLKEYKPCQTNCYILTGTRNFIEPRCYENYFKKLLEICNIPYMNYHVLRHTFATRAVKEMDIKTLSELLGHSDIKLTLKLYVHSSLEEKKDYIEKLASNY